MSRLTVALGGIGICNDWGLLHRFGVKGRDVWVSYTAAEPRTCRCSGSSVHSPSHKTDPSAPWYDNGRKTFLGKRDRSLPSAEAWASTVYGIELWSPSPFGRGSSRIPTYVLLAARKAVKS